MTERARERAAVVPPARVPHEPRDAEALVERAVRVRDVGRIDDRRETPDLHVELAHEERVAGLAHAAGDGERVRAAHRRAREQRVVVVDVQLVELLELDATGGVAEERVEDLAWRAARDELRDDHLGGLLHRRQPEERDEPVHGEERLGRVELDRLPSSRRSAGVPRRAAPALKPSQYVSIHLRVSGRSFAT